MLVIREGEDHLIEDDAQLPYKLIKNLGHGHTATVEMVKDMNTGSLFARKVIPIYASRGERKHIFHNEIKIIRRLAPHRHIIRVFATYVAKRQVGLILHPVADGGDLATFLQDFEEAKAAQPEQPEIIKILESSFGCLAGGLEFMHRQNIRHKDIKPQNILVHRGSMIYTDFGFSLDHSAIGRSTTTGVPHAFTRKYCAPEVSDYGPRNSKSDIFSLGCVFLDILSTLHEELVPLDPGKSYSESLENSQMRAYLKNWNRLGLITSDMLHSRPEDRPSAQAITVYLKHYEVDRFCADCKADMQNPSGVLAANTSTLGTESHSVEDAIWHPYKDMLEVNKDTMLLQQKDQVKNTPVQSRAVTSGSLFANLLGSRSVQSPLTRPVRDRSQLISLGIHDQYPIKDDRSVTYGYDLGLPDLDTPNNDDAYAIAIFNPQNDIVGTDSDHTFVNATMRGTKLVLEKNGYYAKPVPIKIPKSLEPLPPILLENPMNFLYFHHFMNHTARILAAHDCDQNPFRQILPDMAIKDENIMNLLLAFSAMHRARLLNHPGPSNRIAVWLSEVFQNLRKALQPASDASQITNSTLALPIMMASLEIVSPNVFEVWIPWQAHLTIARQILAQDETRTANYLDPAADFLIRWFGYLDVIGSLSGNRNEQPLSYFCLSTADLDVEEDFWIDCITGFTSRCLGILARIAGLAKQCEPARIDEDGYIREHWRPEPDIMMRAEIILRELLSCLSPNRFVYKRCDRHLPNISESERSWDDVEINALNEAFLWAGLIHLYQRVLGRPATDPDVQNAAREIIGLLYKIRRQSPASVLSVFPMFTAGCIALDERQREVIMERLRLVEGFGTAQAHNARSLLKKVWDTGKPWESLISGEFLG
jgi:serine/threonine protein kinase